MTVQSLNQSSITSFNLEKASKTLNTTNSSEKAYLRTGALDTHSFILQRKVAPINPADEINETYCSLLKKAILHTQKTISRLDQFAI